MRRYFFRLLLILGDLFSYLVSFFILLYFSNLFDYTPQLLIVNGVIFFIFMLIEETYSLKEEDIIKKTFFILKGVFFSYFISFLFVYNYQTEEKKYLFGFLTIWYVSLYFIIILVRYILEKLAVKWNIYFRKTLLVISTREDKKVFKDIFYKGFSRINRIRCVVKADKLMKMSDDEINQLIKRHNLSQVIIFAKNTKFEELMRLEEKLEGKVYFIKIVPDFNQLQLAEMEVIYINENLVLETRQRLLSPYRIWVKRFIDIILSIFFIVLFSPVMIITAIFIKLESPGPVFFRQKRLGKKKNVFYAWKFRSMFQNAEEKLQIMLKENEEVRKEYEKYAKLKNDPRITRVGQFIRKYSIDELPQFFNVFSGDMSIMGPRPYLLSELEKMGYKANIILSAKPGVTGLWQIRGRNELTFDERVQLESYYVKNWTLWLDIVILFLTPYAVILKRKTG